MKDERKLSKYIDQLNKEKKPREHKRLKEMGELDELMDTVRRIKGMKEPVMPGRDYPQKLITGLKKEESNTRKERNSNYMRRTMLTVTAAAAAITIFFAVTELSFPGKQVSIVQAMERAISEVKAYHGILEVLETNELGETMTQARREVWADQKGRYRVVELEGYSKGLITVNNQEKQWQLRPQEEKVYLFPAYPDPYRFTFELGSEVENVGDALSVKEIGEERISGRISLILEVTPDGGQPYRLWIDKETKLPLKRQSAMQNAIQISVTYSEIEFMEDLSEDLLVYRLPAGYEEVDTIPEQIVTSLEEASVMAGFVPKTPEDIPNKYYLHQIAVQTQSEAIKMIYKDTDTNSMVIVRQAKAIDTMVPDSQAILGRIGDHTSEILSNYQGQQGVVSIRWQEMGMEYNIYGNLPAEELFKFAKGITEDELVIPSDENFIGKPQIEVPVEFAVEENDQKSVDAGHSPWRLDPAFVAQVFVNLLISPEGIIGDYEIPYEDVDIIHNDGTDAVAEISNGKTIARKVYLKRLVRQDETGIWTVVGYDPVK